MSLTRDRIAYGFLFFLLFIGVSANSYGCSKISSTKSSMSSLKSALVNFNADLGHYPHAGKDKNNGKAYFSGPRSGLGITYSENCLVSPQVKGFENCGLEEKKYQRRWKGPYMDGDPNDFMFDDWGTPYIYIRYEENLYLWSAGYDGEFDDIETVLKADYGEKEGENDLIVSVWRSRKTVGKTSTAGAIANAKKLQIPGKTWTPPNPLIRIIGSILEKVLRIY